MRLNIVGQAIVYILEIPMNREEAKQVLHVKKVEQVMKKLKGIAFDLEKTKMTNSIQVVPLNYFEFVIITNIICRNRQRKR